MDAPSDAGRCLSPEEARKVYDHIGSAQDWQGFYESPALRDLVAHAAFEEAHAIFEFGCGTGAFAARLLHDRLAPEAHYTAFDVSDKMLALARERLQPWRDRAAAKLSDGTPQIPEEAGTVDRFVANYVLDLLAPDYIQTVLAEAHRVLKPGGKLCLVSLTWGQTGFARMVLRMWLWLWRLNPRLVGGCRPIEITDYLPAEKWHIEHRNTITSWGVSSEIVVASAM